VDWQKGDDILARIPAHPAIPGDEVHGETALFFTGLSCHETTGVAGNRVFA
jgi:hypothetical protein